MWDHIEGASVTDLLDRVESYTEFEEGWVDGRKEGRRVCRLTTSLLVISHSDLELTSSASTPQYPPITHHPSLSPPRLVCDGQSSIAGMR
jgi:hypothetical protein